MRSNFRHTLCCALALLLGSSSHLLLGATDKPAAPAVTLEPGMSAAQIVKLLGKPTEVTVINNTNGKAENWIYRKPAATKAGTPATSYQVLTLLIIEEKLVVARQTTEAMPAAGK